MKKTRGLTLVEVIVGLMLLATAMSMMVVAQRRHQHLLDQSQRKKHLSQLADRWLEVLYSRRSGFPEDQVGIVPTGEIQQLAMDGAGNASSSSIRFLSPPIRWSTTTTSRRNLASVPVSVTRFVIADSTGASVSVDLVNPDQAGP